MRRILLKISYIAISIFIIFIPPVIAARILSYLSYVEYNLWYNCGTGAEIQLCRDHWDFWLVDVVDNIDLQLAIIIGFYSVAVMTISYVPARIFFETKKGILFFTIITSIFSIGIFICFILLYIAMDNA